MNYLLTFTYFLALCRSLEVVGVASTPSKSEPLALLGLGVMEVSEKSCFAWASFCWQGADVHH